MPIEERPADLAEICRGVIEEISAAHPSRSFEFSASEDTSESGIRIAWLRR